MTNENTQPSDFPELDPKNDYFEQEGSSSVRENRMFLVAMGLVVAFIVMGMAMFSLFPLKTAVPYTIKVDDAGNVRADPQAAQKYTPGDKEIRSFAAKWAQKLLTVDRVPVVERLQSDVMMLCRDKAVDEYQAWFEANKPIQRAIENSALTADPKIQSSVIISQGVIQVRLRIEERNGTGNQPVVKGVVVTVHYTVIPPITEKEMFDNPIGMFITHFTVNEDLS